MTTFRKPAKHLLVLFITALVMLFAGPAAATVARAAADTVTLLPEDAAFQLDPSRVQFFLEDDGQQARLQREQVLAPEHQSRWQPIVRKSINFGVIDQVVWLRFDVQSAAPEPRRWLISIPWLMLNDIEFSQLHADGRWSELYRSGYDVHYSQRFGQHRQYLLPVDLQPGERSTLLVRLDVKYIAFAPILFWSQEQFSAHDQFDTMFYGLAYGVLLAMLLYNLMLYVFVRDSSYFFYTLYVLSIIFYELAVTGFGERYLWGDIERAAALAYPTFAPVSFVMAALFLRNFLSLKRYGGWVLHTNTAFVLYWILALLVMAGAGPEVLKKINEPMAVLSCIAALTTTIHLWRKGNVSARYFTIAWGFLIVATMFLVLMTLGVLPYNNITEKSQITGFVLETLLLSIALAERINRERAARAANQQLALEMARQVNEERRATLEAQDHAMALQRRHTDELELRVLDRTAELERTMRNLELANRELAKLSVTDPLTGLHNRRYFDEVLADEIQRGQRFNQPLSLILVDVDHFKRINDTYGHLLGDECLRLLAATLRQVISRATDMVARYGGEEFAVILAGTSAEEAAVVANRIREAIEKLQFIHAGKRIALSASLGVAGRIPLQHESSARLIAAADEALYQAKENGRNRVVMARLQAEG